MSEKQHRDQIDRYTKDLADLRKKEAAANASATKDRASAATSRARIKPNTSQTTARSYENTAQRHDRQADAAEKRAADLAKKIAECTKKLNTAQTNLERAKTTTARREDQAASRRRRAELDHARRVAQVSRPVIHHIHEVRQVPIAKIEELRVLYLTANPLVADPETNLRVDAEVAQVQRAVRGALLRDYVRIEHRPAATPEDLMDGLNDLAPHAVHFSGHGGGAAVLMDNSSVAEPEGRAVAFDLLGRVLDSAGRPPTLLVLAACDTLDGAAEHLLPAVPLVIAMKSTVTDTVAATFSARFYGAVASGLSVQKACDQGMLAVELIGLDGGITGITLIRREDVDPAEVFLVRPPDGNTDNGDPVRLFTG